MAYLKLKRSQIILASFFLFSTLVAVFPAIDISISEFFFDGNSFLRERWWQKLLQAGLGYFLCLSLIAIVAIYAFNRLLKRNLCGVDGRRVLFAILVLAIGAGLIVNATLKDNFGRARPRDVVEFGGTRQFTPAFYISRECNTNCSFSSGDAAGGFFSLALALALSRRRAFYVAGIAIGVLVSFSRIASGAHFFSDTVVSFFIMLIVADVLFFYLVLTGGSVERVSLPRTTLRPAFLLLNAVEAHEKPQHHARQREQ